MDQSMQKTIKMIKERQSNIWQLQRDQDDIEEKKIKIQKHIIDKIESYKGLLEKFVEEQKLQYELAEKSFDQKQQLKEAKYEKIRLQEQ
jgi:hypothetical protein